jgi:hypothetical protein
MAFENVTFSRPTALTGAIAGDAPVPTSTLLSRTECELGPACAECELGQARSAGEMGTSSGCSRAVWGIPRERVGRVRRPPPLLLYPLSLLQMDTSVLFSSPLHVS